MRKTLAVAAVLVALSVFADEPKNYYSPCQGLYGAQLLAKLQTVVGSHTVVSYDGLIDLYETTDLRADGTIWDMYATSSFRLNAKQCGNYKNVGDCWNREHSMPKSWFNDAKPMYSDAFHLYPTDGKVNGQRSNYPYGECANGTILPSNGSVRALGKLGNSTFSGYSGKVFEPDDEYKGDFARSYFYMVAAYNDKVKGWSTTGTNLGGTAYPAFNSWSVELLMKWHRQDPVSQKEINRNEAVYAAQKNRNPFIDHPELAEHIWGDKKNTGWTGAAADPELTSPVDGATLGFGTTMPGSSLTARIVVKGNNLTDNITVSVAGSAFTASASTIAVSAANAATGYTLTITYKPSAAGTHTGTVKLTSGKLSSTVALTGTAINTIPAGPVTAVADDSFEAVWTYVGDDIKGKYTLDVTDDGGRTIAGYPVSVEASDEYYVVTGLEPSTTYKYTVASANHVSSQVSVTTLEPIPSIDVLFDGTLEFTAKPGEPSEAAELLLDIDNIDSPITIRVNSPFQLSEDKDEWTESITIEPSQDRFYLRMYATAAGTFSGTLVITAGDYVNDDVDFTGSTASYGSFHEDFEADAAGFANYNGGTYQGTGAKWVLANAGIYPGASTDRGYNSAQAIRFGKDETSSITMAENTPGGIGTVTLWAKKWDGKDGDATFHLEYSIDGGTTWTDCGEARVTATDYTQYTFAVNSSEPVRLRVRQTSGDRWFVDEIDAKASSSVLVPEFAADYHRWDAFCRGAQLMIEADEPVEAVVYALDATEVFVGRVEAGLTAISAAPGLYIVAVDGFARRVLVK